MKGLIYVPLTPEEAATLATYNAEVARGLLHSADWIKLMAALQTRYNRTQ